MLPCVLSSLFSACRPSFWLLMVMVPPATEISSFASIASAAHSIAREPPVILTSSLPETPLPVEETVSEPSPLNTMSSLANITASVLVSPSAVNAPVTVSVLAVSFWVVTNTLSAFLT